ncbi:MAG: DUF4258 domain-containing protein [Firmicutes bacterium]|nr:DUF4258 domain-containing protein [Bacillota bacterium]
MTDIAPELLEKVQQSFEAETAGLRDEIANGVKSYEEAYSYAIQVGEALSKSFGVNITPEVLPDGMMYYNIADKVVRPMLQAEYEISSAAAVQAQRSANRAAGIGIKAQVPDFDEERAQGIIDRVSSQPFDEVSWLLNEPVKTFSKNVVDNTLQKNVEFQGKSGLSPKIRRTTSGETCKWCQEVAGVYEYPNVPGDVYRRHANCDCVVEYIDGGKVQNVHTKQVRNAEERDRMIIQRSQTYQSTPLKFDLQFFAKKTKHAAKRAIERGISDEDIDDALANPLNGEGGELVIDEFGEESIKFIGRKVTVCISTEESDDIEYTVWKTSKSTRKRYGEE